LSNLYFASFGSKQCCKQFPFPVLFVRSRAHSRILHSRSAACKRLQLNLRNHGATAVAGAMEICGGSMPTGNLPSALPTIRVIPMRAPESLKPLDMLAELRNDNASLTQTMRELHSLCDEAGDVATASLLENWIDESNERTWFLSECCCRL